MAGEVERLAYETSLKALEDQSSELNQLRAQTGTLLAAGAITASFLGAQTLTKVGNSGGFGFFGWAALVAFVVSTISAVYVLLPKTGFTFSFSAPVLYEALVSEGEAEAHRRLAYWYEDFWNANRKKLDWLVIWFFVAAGALVIEVICWAFALRARLT